MQIAWHRAVIVFDAQAASIHAVMARASPAMDRCSSVPQSRRVHGSDLSRLALARFEAMQFSAIKPIADRSSVSLKTIHT